MHIDTIKKSYRETALEIENLGKRSEVIDANINRMQEREERISCVQNIDSKVTENEKCKKFLTKNIQEIQGTMRKPNLRIILTEESKIYQPKGPVNIINKITERKNKKLP